MYVLECSIFLAVFSEPPFFDVRPSEYYQGLLSDRVVMHCVARGSPTPEVTWRKVEGLFPSSRKTMVVGGNLTIVDLSVEDQGRYECVATNVVASIIAGTTLLVECKYLSPSLLFVLLCLTAWHELCVHVLLVAFRSASARTVQRQRVNH